LQRAILVREGHLGRSFDTLPERCFTVPLDFDVSSPDCLMPGKKGELISRRGAVVERDKFERMKDEYYRIRHWDVDTGLQTSEVLQALGLKDVAQDLQQRGLLGPLDSG
jgi:aldehyde:ferredoxin oxidoreductase